MKVAVKVVKKEKVIQRALNDSVKNEMNIIDYCEHILLSPKIEDKLLPPSDVICFERKVGKAIPDTPARDIRYKFSEKRAKFPKRALFMMIK